MDSSNINVTNIAGHRTKGCFGIMQYISPTPQQPRLSATLAVSSECLSSLPIIALLLMRRALSTRVANDLPSSNTATPVLNCTVFLESQDLVSKATRADIIHANTLHAWRRITMTKILRGRMELRIEVHESET